MPGDYQNICTPFERLVILRALRPDRVTTALKSWISEVMGSSYVYQAPFDMEATYYETSNQTPTFFVLFPGVDPTTWVENLGIKFGITFEAGTLLQNCHLMQSWVPKLERLLEVVQEGAHENFRCFVSAEPRPCRT